MPEHLRALVIILVLAAVVFALAKAPACALASSTEDFERRRNLWFAITLTAFLAHNFWIYIVVAAALLLFALPREPNRLAMYFLLLFAVPPIADQIDGLGLVNHFFAIDYLRLLALAILLPEFLSLRAQSDVDRFGRTLPDKLVLGYLVLNLVLQSTVDTLTNTLRQGVFYAFVDVFLPYYVASRSLKNLQRFREALMAFVVAGAVLSLIGAFEMARHWLLYNTLDDVLGAPWGYGNYVERGDTLLRAQGSTGHPIALGYVTVVAAGFLLYLRRSVPNSAAWRLGLALLVAGLVASLSRGPWLGALAVLLVFVVTGPSAARGFARLGVLGAFVLPVLLASPAGQTIIDHLPFVGTIEAENVTYRQRLLEISMQTIMRNPLFGVYDYAYSPAMQELKQGQGIIDIVNSYLEVGLSSGLAGLSLFSGVFITAAVGILVAMKNLADKNDEPYLLGQALLATLLGIMVIIFTVSSILVIPAIYWSVAGLGVAYARMIAPGNLPGAAGPAGAQAPARRSKGRDFGARPPPGASSE